MEVFQGIQGGGSSIVRPVSPQTNPTERLHRVIEDLLSHRDEVKLRQAWPLVFDIDEGNLSLLLKRLADVLALPDQVRLATGELSAENAESVEQYLSSYEVVLSNPLANNCKWAKGAIPAEAREGMKLIGRILAETSGPDLSSEQAQLLRDQALDLLGDVTSSDLDSDLRSALAEQLREFIDALNRVEVAGTAPIRNAALVMIGDAAMSQVNLDKRVIPWYKKTLSLAALTLQLLGSASNIAALPMAIDYYSSDDVEHVLEVVVVEGEVVEGEVVEGEVVEDDEEPSELTTSDDEEP